MKYAIVREDHNCGRNWCAYKVNWWFRLFGATILWSYMIGTFTRDGADECERLLRKSLDYSKEVVREVEIL